MEVRCYSLWAKGRLCYNIFPRWGTCTSRRGFRCRRHRMTREEYKEWDERGGPTGEEVCLADTVSDCMC